MFNKSGLPRGLELSGGSVFELKGPDTRWRWILILAGYTVGVLERESGRRRFFQEQKQGSVVTGDCPERLPDSREGLSSRFQSLLSEPRQSELLLFRRKIYPQLLKNICLWCHYIKINPPNKKIAGFCGTFAP